MNNRIILIIAIFTIQACVKKESAVVPSSLIKFFDKSSLPSAVMGYSTKDGGATTWYAFGPSIWGKADTVSEDHIFRITSMTKAITSVAALQLVEKGLLGLDDPLNELMPEMVSIPILMEDGELVQTDKVITLKHLLTHTSGFGDKGMSARLTDFKPKDWKYEDMPRLFEPGAQWKYGSSFKWVGKIIEKVSGQDLETYFRENVTGPLQMNHTWFNVPDSLKDKIVSWGIRDSIAFQENPRIPKQAVTTYNAGGGLFGSPKDYLTFLTCLLDEGKYEGGQLLKPESVNLMFKNHLADNMTIDYELPDTLSVINRRFLDESDKHGLAWAIEANADERIRPKGSGYWGGVANCYYSIDNENGLAIVYFNQFLPFNDKEAYEFYRLFEKEVYSKIRSK